MTCKSCYPSAAHEMGSYEMACIDCTARWILEQPRLDRKQLIEGNERHDVTQLKKKVTDLFYKRLGKSNEPKA